MKKIPAIRRFKIAAIIVVAVIPKRGISANPVKIGPKKDPSEFHE